MLFTTQHHVLEHVRHKSHMTFYPKLGSASLEFQQRSIMDDKLPSYQLMATPRSSTTKGSLRTCSIFLLAASIILLACATLYSTHYALLQTPQASGVFEENHLKRLENRPRAASSAPNYLPRSNNENTLKTNGAEVCRGLHFERNYRGECPH